MTKEYQGIINCAMSHKKLANRAMKLAGGSQSAFARALSEHAKKPILQGTVAHWVHGRRQVSLQNAILIERATGGEVKAQDFYPEIRSAC